MLSDRHRRSAQHGKSHFFRHLRLRPHKVATVVLVPPVPPAARGLPGQGRRIAAGKGIFPAAYTPDGGNGVGGAPLFARASSRAQIAARATCGKGLARVAAANRFHGAWVGVRPKKKREQVPLSQLFNQLIELVPN